MKVATPVFDGISEKKIRGYLEEAGLPSTGKSILYDGRTGEALRPGGRLLVTCIC